jgi:hypothetical protein
VALVENKASAPNVASTVAESAATVRRKANIRHPAKPLNVLPSKGSPDVALGVQSFLPLFLRWREAGALFESEPRRLSTSDNEQAVPNSAQRSEAKSTTEEPIRAVN